MATSEMVTISRDVWDTIVAQANSLKEQDNRINRMIAEVKERTELFAPKRYPVKLAVKKGGLYGK